MKKNLDKLFKQFIDKNLKGFKYVYLTSDLRGFLLKYKKNDADELCKIFISYLLKKKLLYLFHLILTQVKISFTLKKQILI